MTATYDEVYINSLNYFGGDSLAAGVFAGKYALCDKDGNFLEKDPDDMHRRMASEFARIEQKYKNAMTYEEIYNLFRGFKDVIPQGSPMSAIGNNHQIQSLSNCFVIESPYDSYGGILKADQELVQIAKRRGGVGFDLSTIRPKGLATSNAARTTDGIEVFMERFSNSTREVAQGGRRGALMLTISVHHPQIRDFIRIKRDLSRITGANISIRLSDEFMKAVDSKSDFQLRFPVDNSNPAVSEMICASELWDEIIESAHACAEPGLLFWDNAKKLTPSQIYEDEGFGSTSTNPCGEIILSPYDSCRLMLVNLASFVKDPFDKIATFDFKRFGEVVQKAQRLMDDMIDLEVEQIDKILAKVKKDPEPNAVKQIEINLWKNIRDRALKGRRTGLGVTAVGDTLASLGITYGSDRSVEKVEEIYKSLCLNAYKSSCNLAKERGAFPVHNHEKEEHHPFLSRIWEADSDILKMSKKFGRRNIALLTTAPAGSVSTLTQTTSGIEPAYLIKYTRRKKISNISQDEHADFVDETGDRWTEHEVYHHGFKKWMDVTGLKNIEDSPYWNATSADVDWVQKIKVQAAAQKWICHAISNTTNVPEDTSQETVKEIYLEGWRSGCKGVTVYRDGSRSGVLVSKKEDSFDAERDRSEITYHSAPRREKTLPCEIHRATIKGEDWTILVGILKNSPYEIIGGLSKYVEIPKKYSAGVIVKHPRKTMNSKYDLIFGENDDEFIIKDVVAVFDNPNHSAFTRTISLALRHGVPMQYVVEQLQKDKDADLFSFAKVTARVLKKYIADGTRASNGVFGEACCDNPNIAYQEGCATCVACGMAKCG